MWSISCFSIKNLIINLITQNITLKQKSIQTMIKKKTLHPGLKLPALVKMLQYYHCTMQTIYWYFELLLIKKLIIVNKHFCVWHHETAINCLKPLLLMEIRVFHSGLFNLLCKSNIRYAMSSLVCNKKLTQQ